MRRINLPVVTMKSAFPSTKMTLCNASAMMASKEHLAVLVRIFDIQDDKFWKRK